ncbi:LLM class F420-dependent oxidoreductase [Goodfellowiella coeruleoviolacea]|uniref:F420-dependent oxidoreductase, MSMEG_4141 family n=1 Tax=Goodfellowiella coeruleoviolacea TaxID=334858 RepID=A0AAE3KGS1_9PSEU|nr:LLM class F420-dependent oxidoreductase [Goodfellowiella coeruleoviolacea]MCP2166192.1 putative F420-dependent oxidoreductase, MSMEG_4141 family [Goodfellowiella coeruleoviolacea]
MAVDVGRVGVWATGPHWGGSAGQEAVAELEELGYGAFWLGGSPSGDLRQVAELLAATKAMPVATGIVNVWQDAADVVAASYNRVVANHPNRFLLGIGAGHPQATAEYTRPYDKLVNYLDTLDAADPPVPADHRVLAALGPKVLHLASQRTAGAHPYLVNPEHTHRARTVLGPEPLLAPEQKVVLETDPDRARAIARAGVAMYLALTNYTNNFRRLGYTDEDFADGGSDRLIDGLVAWGDEAAVLARISEHHQAGADHVAIQVLTEDGNALAPLRRIANALFT